MIFFGLTYLVLSVVCFFKLVLRCKSRNSLDLIDGFNVKYEKLDHYSGYWNWDRNSYPLIFGAQKLLFVFHFWQVKAALGSGFREETLYLQTMD